MELILSVLLLGIILLGIGIYYVINFQDEYIPTEYEKELIEYFKEVVLESEYYERPMRVVKWQRPMILFVSKEKKYVDQMKAIEKTVANINELVVDGFEIKLTDDLSKSNAVLYLGTLDRVAELAPDFYQYMDDDIIDEDFSGFTYVEFEWSNYTILKASIFIEIEDSLEVQKSTILEEITQSIGIPNDSEKYLNSIFYQHQIENGIINKEYSKMDIDIIKLLYHPKMKPGLNSKECEKAIKRILKKSHKKESYSEK